MVSSLVRAIAQRYAEVYRVEAATTRTPVGKVPGMANRNATNGEYGISMHDLEATWFSKESTSRSPAPSSIATWVMEQPDCTAA